MIRNKRKHLETHLTKSGQNQSGTKETTDLVIETTHNNSAVSDIPIPVPGSIQTVISRYAVQSTTTTIKTISEEQIQKLRDLGIPLNKIIQLSDKKNATVIVKQLIDHYATLTSFGFEQYEILEIALRSDGEKLLHAILTYYVQLTSVYKFTSYQIKQIITTSSGDRNIIAVCENYATLSALLKSESTSIINEKEIYLINKEIVAIAINYHGDKNITTLISRYNDLLEKKYTKGQIILLAKHQNASRLMEALNTHHDKYMEHGFNHQQLMTIACNCKTHTQNLNKLYIYLDKLGKRALSVDELTKKLARRDDRFLEDIPAEVTETINSPSHRTVLTMPSIAKRPGLFPLPGMKPSLSSEVQQKKHKTQDTQRQQKLFETAAVPMPWNVQSVVSPVNAQYVGQSIDTTLTSQMLDTPKVDALQPKHPERLNLNSVYNEIDIILEQSGYSELDRERSLIAISAHIVSLLELKLPIHVIAKISVLPICAHVVASLITYSNKYKIIGDELVIKLNHLINPSESSKRKTRDVRTAIDDVGIISTQMSQSGTQHLRYKLFSHNDSSNKASVFNVENSFKPYQPVASQMSAPFTNPVKIEPVKREDDSQVKVKKVEDLYTIFRFDETALENSFKQWCEELDSAEPSKQSMQSTYPKRN